MGIGVALAVLVVVAIIANRFRGDSMVKDTTLDTVNNITGTISAMCTIYTTLASYDTIAGGTLGVEG